MTSWTDLEVMARTVYGEARGEPDTGQRAVAHVILNRLRDKRWPDSIKDVCLQPKQFSCWNEDDPNRERILSASLDASSFRLCAIACLEALEAPTDITEGSTHYCTIRSEPYWATGHEPILELANHKFFNDIR